MRPPPLPALQFGLEGIDLDAFGELPIPAIQAALKRGAFLAAEELRRRWVIKARELRVWNTGEYVRGIEENAKIVVVKETANIPENGTAGLVQVVIDVTNTARHASYVEDGHGPFHLPDKVDWATAKNVKVAKNGTRYITVPFRHAAYASPSQQARQGTTQGTLARMMPRAIYQQALKLDYSRRMNAGRQFTASGQYVAADKYKWGGRLTRDVAIGATLPHPGGGTLMERRGETTVAPGFTNPAWAASRFAGMVKMNVKGHSEYLTFRIMKENSPGWNVPAMAGRGVARAVAQEAQNDPDLQEIFALGVAETMGGA